ncbi:MAG: DNA-directed RNA polymerase subunit beta, partial [Oscillospiraceae bacterium]|nr:DNA-directed RNA polymerase subunit beta [Oscillospiraceae bacterium]
MLQVKPVNLGKNVRMSFGKINEVLDMPNLIEVQKNSYRWFLEEGLRDVFNDMSAITDYQGNLVLDFIDYRLEDKPKYTIEECKERDTTYAAPLIVTTSLLNRETGEIKEQEIFMGDFPLMTESGTFVINGAERVIVSQLVRSPGVYYSRTRDKSGRELYACTVIPNRGAWLEYETDSNGIFYARIDKNRKLPVTTFIRALGVASDEQMLELFGECDLLRNTLEKDTIKTVNEALQEVYRKLRPGEPPTVESAKSHINALFFDPRRYDLSKVGRYKYNKKLAIGQRIIDRRLAEDVIDPLTGVVMFEKDAVLSREDAMAIERAGVNAVSVYSGETVVKVISNGMVDMHDFIDCEALGITAKEKVRFTVLCEIIEEANGDDEVLKAAIEQRADDLVPKHIIVDDIFATVNYLCSMSQGVGIDDDIDHLGNRRIRSVGELLQNQFRIGFSRMERVIRERMATQSQDQGEVTAQALINIRPVVAAIKEFFGSSPLSQFMDQTNPLAELTHKRRLSALGPGGLSRDRAGFEVRDVHYSHYGRMCPIETPEGPNIGLISYLATFARINEYGFIEAPYRKVERGTGKICDEVVYMTADVEDSYVVAQANEPIDENGYFVNAKVAARYRDSIMEIDREQVDFMDISPKMVVSVATAMIPFLENDDANRALMGANMQRQAVPLLKTESPYVGTGMEYKAAVDSGVAVIAKHNGVVKSVSANLVVVTDEQGVDRDYRLIKFMRSNQGTCINQRPVVAKGDVIKVGDVIADGPATSNGEISLGKNMLIGFMTWEGYNYEDAVLINERLVKEDLYTSIHIEEYETDARDTKLGPEEITRDIPNVGEDVLKELDERGI